MHCMGLLTSHALFVKIYPNGAVPRRSRTFEKIIKDLPTQIMASHCYTGRHLARDLFKKAAREAQLAIC